MTRKKRSEAFWKKARQTDKTQINTIIKKSKIRKEIEEKENKGID